MFESNIWLYSYLTKVHFVRKILINKKVNVAHVIAVAAVCVYGDEVTLQNLRPDETLLYFTSLAHHMDATIVIKKVRIGIKEK